MPLWSIQVVYKEYVPFYRWIIFPGMGVPVCYPFTHWRTIGLVSSLKPLQIKLLEYSFLLRRYPGVGLYGKCMFSFIINCHTFPEWPHHLHAHYQCVRDPISSHPRQHWVTSVFFISAMRIDVQGAPFDVPSHDGRKVWGLQSLGEGLQISLTVPAFLSTQQLRLSGISLMETGAPDMGWAFRFVWSSQLQQWDTTIWWCWILSGSTSWPRWQTIPATLTPLRWYESHDMRARRQGERGLGPPAALARDCVRALYS